MLGHSNVNISDFNSFWVFLGHPVYRVYQKKGNRTLQCSSAFIIQSTEIILSQAERPGFQLSIVIIFVKFEERLGKYESNENSRPKSHIFTVGSLLKIC